jgi:hypothetical protein
MFRQDPEATHILFIDSDVKFDPTAVLRILERQEELVCGIYPWKTEAGGFPVQIETIDGVPRGKADGLILAKFCPTGFMRIKRESFDRMEDAYPELKYEDSVLRIDDLTLNGAVDFFGMGVFGRRFTTEDFAFCQRWRDLGGQLWVLPDIDFEHIGQKAYKANYHRYLLQATEAPKETACH